MHALVAMSPSPTLRNTWGESIDAAHGDHGTMTESDWLHAVEPHGMLEYLHGIGRPSDRKLRLFAVACTRRMGDWVDALGQTAVDTAEAYADGFATFEDMRSARLACQGSGERSAWYAAATSAAIAARNAARSAQSGANLRSPAALARSIYLHRTFAQMPNLADELVLAGCADAAILTHCRTPQPHVRGCWVLDLVIGHE